MNKPPSEEDRFRPRQEQPRRPPPDPRFWAPPNRVIARLRADIDVEYTTGVEEQLRQKDFEGAERLGQMLESQDTTLVPMHDAVPPEKLRDWIDSAVGTGPDLDYDELGAWFDENVGRADGGGAERGEWVRRPPQPDTRNDSRTPFQWFVVDAPDQESARALVGGLGEIDLFDIVELDEPAIDPVSPDNDPWWPSQGYLDPAPEGIDAEFAWTQGGGDGSGVGFVDVEGGWTLSHEDLVAHNTMLLSGVLKPTSRAHGTKVLGVVCARDNNVGCVGIAPGVDSVSVSSHGGLTSGFANAIYGAIDSMVCGDVLLLEIQTGWPYGLPGEALERVYWATRAATSQGIIVVAAAGNGDENLDTFQDVHSGRVLSPDSADFRDSGAIIVGASKPGAWPTRRPGSTYGRRVDCFAWGSDVATATSNEFGDTDDYTSSFNGTSSAAAIVAGAAIVTQGVALAATGRRIRPWLMRLLLSHPALGTSTDDPADLIGVMPDLARVLPIVDQLPAWAFEC